MEKIKASLGIKVSPIITAVGTISGLCTIYGNDKIKTVAQIATIICIGLVVIIVLQYTLSWLESSKKIDAMENQLTVINNSFSEILPSIKSIPEIKIKEESSFSEVLSKVTELENKINVVTASNQDLKNEIENITLSKGIICPVTRASYAENSEDVNHILYNILKQRVRDVKKLSIICFGRNGFGGLVKYLIERSSTIQVEIIVFNTEAQESICREDDKNIIERNIKSWLNARSPQISVFVTDIPPMIRAAVAYSKDGPIWGTIQSYRFTTKNNGKGITLEKPPASLISVCDERSTTAEDFNSLVGCFEEEFKRLKQSSKIPYVEKSREGSILAYKPLSED